VALKVKVPNPAVSLISFCLYDLQFPSRGSRWPDSIEQLTPCTAAIKLVHKTSLIHFSGRN
jgi:hypothetical protein